VSDTPFVRWHRRILGICLVVFAFELGLFLLIFPWLPNWDVNWIPVHFRPLSDVWMNQYFRGALSGLGLLNIYVAVGEAGRQIVSVFSRKTQ
jgi:hypothetical protein